VRVVTLSNWATLALDVVGWAVIHTATGYFVYRLPLDALTRDRWPLRLRRFERDGSFSRRRLRIGTWKDRVPEAGALFTGGMSKRTLPRSSAGGLERFAAETRRAELGHWLALAASPFFVLWNPPVAAVCMLVYGVAVNGPCIAIQRYNRARVERALRTRAERSTGKSIP
jgi:glycosyl-4,4'-diaponeurosporenoate acyltransferase